MAAPVSLFKNAIKKDVGNSATAIYTAPAGAAYLIECDVACTGNSGVQISVMIVDASEGDVSAYLVKDAPVPVGSSIQIIDGQKIVLEDGDSIKVVCETADQTVDVILSLVEGVNL